MASRPRRRDLKPRILWPILLVLVGLYVALSALWPLWFGF
jgi:hypothetical protein